MAHGFYRVIGRLVFLSFTISHFGYADTPKDITELLASLPGVTYREILAPAPEEAPTPPGYRRFELTIEQPVDHFEKGSPTFRQKLTLLHKDTAAPLVLHTSGYSIFTVKLSAIAKTFQTNQLQIEHRFFDQSAPDVLEWDRLNIVQSAADFHLVTETFKKIYPGRWVNTGASKGGMTSVYHRRFYPQDLDGTVADVAPLSFAQQDPRYIAFVDNAGGPQWADCRAKLEALQIALLKRRNEMLPRVSGSFVYLGGKSVAFEHAVIEFPFTFWQYKKPTDVEVGCDKLPATDAPAVDVMAWLEKVNAVKGYGDTDLFSFMPYYFQAATQLGGPASKLHHLAPYRLHHYNLGQYTPPKTKIEYSSSAMWDVEGWVRNEADHIMFVYGEFDPWSAAAFPKSKGATDFHWYQAPGGNHGSNFLVLSDDDKAKATATIAGWLNVPARVNARATQDTLDAFEFEYRRQHHLP